MQTIITVEIDEKSGIVFFDDSWNAYGWQTEDFTNGPFETAEEAESSLREELTADEPR